MNQTDRESVGGVTFYPRGVKKIYVADFWHNGVHCRKSLKVTNKKVARDRAVQLAAELSQGHYRPAPSPVCVADAYAAYLTYLATENRAPKTLTKYKGVFETFAAFLGTIRVTKLGQVTAAHFDTFRAGRAETRHPKTRYTEGVIIKQLFRWAKTRKLITDNPLVDIKLHKPRSGSKPTLSLDQVDRILASAKLPLRTYLSVLAFTGIRSGELRRLRPEDVDIAGGWVHVRSRPGEETKTRRERKLPVHPRLRPILESAVKAGGAYLFTVGPSRRYPAGGRPLNLKRLNEQFGRLVGRLGLPVGRRAYGFVIHSLRHFFKTFTINNLVPDRAVDKWMGHERDQSPAAEYYRLPDPESQDFMKQVPFGTGLPAANADKEVEQ